jgi:hypothetical protein
MSQTIVQWFGAQASTCGYCAGPDDTWHTVGMWANVLTTHDYQVLLGRRFRLPKRNRLHGTLLRTQT